HVCTKACLPPSVTRHDTDQRRTEQATCQRAFEGTRPSPCRLAYSVLDFMDYRACDTDEPVWKIAQHVRGKSYRENLAYPATGVMAGEAHHDSQTLVRPVSTVFAQEGPKDIEAAKSRHVQDTRSGGAARASRAVLQTSRLGGPTRAARRLPNIQARFDLVAGLRRAAGKAPPETPPHGGGTHDRAPPRRPPPPFPLPATPPRAPPPPPPPPTQ